MKNQNHAFIHSLISLLENGCTIRESLEMLSSEKTALDISEKASLLLDGLKKGESLSAGFIASVFKETKYHPFLLQLEQTGNILSSLRLILEDMERNSETRKRIAQALMYPSIIILIVVAYLIILFARGIPWMEATGLIKDAAIVSGMKKGTGIAALFLFASSCIGLICTTLIIQKKQTEYSFWSILVSLTDSGFSFDQALGVCAHIGTVPYTLDNEDYFFNSKNMDSFSHTTLLTAKMTGDYQSAFKVILLRHRIALESLFVNFGKLVEPLIMAIAGIVLMILSVTVLLPLVTQNGGII